MMKVLITDRVAEEAIDLFRKANLSFNYEEMDGDTLLREISKYDALMVRSRTKVFKEVIKAGTNLKVIGRAGIGVDNIDIEAAAKAGIKVVNAPTGATVSVAELTIGHMLSLSRHLTSADQSMKRGEWAKKELRGIELYGKTLGLVGSGNIGRLVARYARFLGMKVIGYDPYVSKEDMKSNGIEKIESLKELVKNADFVSLHLPHTPDTHHLIDEKILEEMKPSAFLINCARGGIVDENALYRALKNKKIAGAALDVFEEEPPRDSPLLKLENVVFSPHLGANTKEGQIRAGTICAEQIIKVLNGEKPDYWVNKHLM